MRRFPIRRRRRTAPRTRIRKRAVLNVTSRKKRDTMLSFSNSDGNGVQRAPAAGPAVIRGDSIGVFFWCPTARVMDTAAGVPGSVIQEAVRTSTTCYWRGVKESIDVETNTGVPWYWRRIVFTYRALHEPFNEQVPGSTDPLATLSPYIESSNGYARFWNDQTINNAGTTGIERFNILFRGSQGQDWSNLMTAPVDTRRVGLLYDKRIPLSSGNANGVYRQFQRWHPFNKNIVYDDDETGDQQFSSVFSVDDKRGLGNVYILDMIVAGAQGTASDLLRVESTATAYWHEK